MTRIDFQNDDRRKAVMMMVTSSELLVRTAKSGGKRGHFQFPRFSGFAWMILRWTPRPFC